MRRIAKDVKIISAFDDHRVAYSKSSGRFSILDDKKALQKILGEAREQYDLIAKAETDFYYLIARSLSATRDDIGQNPLSNGNGDCHVYSELTRSSKQYKVPYYKTFVARGVFINHCSDDVTKCFGTHLDVRIAQADDFRSVSDTSIHNLLAIDKAKAHDIGIWSGIKSGTVTTWSMGCDIESAVCSICDNEVTNERPQACEHIKLYKNSEMISESKRFNWNGRRVKVADILIAPTFIELSAVTVPADYTAETQEVLGDINRSAEYIPPYTKIMKEESTERLGDIIPNGDGSYTAVFTHSAKAQFGDYQSALDWLQSKKLDRQERQSSYKTDKVSSKTKSITLFGSKNKSKHAISEIFGLKRN